MTFSIEYFRAFKKMGRRYAIPPFSQNKKFWNFYSNFLILFFLSRPCTLIMLRFIHAFTWDTMSFYHLSHTHSFKAFQTQNSCKSPKKENKSVSKSIACSSYHATSPEAQKRLIHPCVCSHYHAHCKHNKCSLKE